MTNKVKPSDQFPQLVSDKVRTAMIALADKIDERERELVYRTYNDPEIHKIYKAHRDLNKIDKKANFTDKKSMRKIASIPNMSVYNFLQSHFEPWYGPDWIENKKVLRHDFLKPWLLVDNI